ncbi:MAG: NTP transferase domain-containing protein [Armatimonadetes bacterium]|nr:NTP transferase domain-containing protein [Armatimonadota bacterium]
MKGVILVGGLGTRLLPMTRVTNKHLLPVGRFPMVYYPLYNLVEAGVRDIMIVTGGNSPGDFLELLHDGSEFGLEHLTFTYQRGAGGIADALRLARSFVADERVIVMLGDNVLGGSIRPFVESYLAQPSGAKVLLKAVRDPERFGVAELDADGRVTGIVEKPDRPASDLAVVGVYMYDQALWEILPTLKPSARGQLEITDVNNAYLARGELSADVLDFEWSDAGTPESLARAAEITRESEFWRQAGLPTGQNDSL